MTFCVAPLQIFEKLLSLLHLGMPDHCGPTDAVHIFWWFQVQRSFCPVTTFCCSSGETVKTNKQFAMWKCDSGNMRPIGRPSFLVALLQLWLKKKHTPFLQLTHNPQDFSNQESPRFELPHLSFISPFVLSQILFLKVLFPSTLSEQSKRVNLRLIRLFLAAPDLKDLKPFPFSNRTCLPVY